VKDFLFFSQSQDSIFLNVFSYRHLQYIRKERFITTVGGYNSHKDFHYVSNGVLDVNNDGVEEVFFTISGVFALFPRRVFRYDFAHDELLKGMNTGVYHFGQIQADKSDTLLLLVSPAYGNTPSDFPYSYRDTCCWLFAYDKNLEFVNQPSPIGTVYSNLYEPIQYKEHFYFLYNGNELNGVCSVLYKVDSKGHICDSLLLSKSYKGLFKVPFTSHSYYIEDAHSKEAIVLNLDKFKLTKKKTFTHFRFDYDEKLKSGILAIACNESTFYYKYSDNPYHVLRYPFAFAVYLISVLFIAFIVYKQNKRLENRQALEHQINDLQLQNLRAQLDPHFTFNALNSVANAIYKEDKEAAYDLFQRFTRMIRSSLMMTDKVFRTLEEELQFTSDYLEFQKTRFKTRFDYSIIVEEAISTSDIQIPKMLIQNFAENAVKHAFHGVDYKGEISISVLMNNDKIVIHIEDNGIGINTSKAQGHTSGTQKGKLLMQSQIAQINKMYGRDMSLSIADKSDSSLESGTLVSIVL
jgi:two-component sensor histidine kinase